MNYLAHVLLSCEDEYLLVGNFLGDLLRNQEVRTLPDAYQKGVQLHRFIDSFTDTHPLVRQGVRRLKQQHGKYGPVVIDVLYDYVLANNWALHHDLALEDFSQNVYRTLEGHLPIMPERVQAFVPRMIADDWLVRYRSVDGIAFAISRLQRRASQPEFFENIADTLEAEYPALALEFASFFPDIKAATADFCGC